MAIFFKKTAKEAASAFPVVRKVKASSTRERIAHRVLLRPHVTEKAGKLAQMNQYVFRIAARTTKQEIVQAVVDSYGVRPVAVSTVTIAGKRRRLGTREGRISGYKKAIVTLPEGKTIEVLPR